MSSLEREPGSPESHVAVHIAPTAALAARLPEIRRLCERTFEHFSEHAWQHALGGDHVLAVDRGRVVAHAAVVPRAIAFGERSFRVGYVEAVAVLPERQGRGLGARIMRAATAHVDRRYDAGVLSTGHAAFYERFGWQVWSGPGMVRRRCGELVATPDDDGGILVRRTAALRSVPDDATIIADARDGDVW